MRVTHQLHIMAICPINGRHDIYDVTLETDRVVEVELIEQIALSYSGRRILQEDLTRELAERLEMKVTTHGRHGVTGSVSTTVVAGERDPFFVCSLSGGDPEELKRGFKHVKPQQKMKPPRRFLVT